MFSEQYGYKSEKEIQYESVSDALRVRIWNLFYQYDIQAKNSLMHLTHAMTGEPTIDSIIADRLGFNVCHAPTPQVMIENFIVNECQWYEIFDFIEIHLECLNEEKRATRIEQYNHLLETEKSAYRVIAGKVVPISNEYELSTIEEASHTVYDSINVHVEKALSLYADRQNPDYENSIKESISAVESVCCIITGMTGKNATLGNTIKKLKDNGVYIHSAMEKAFSSLYGYTSDENGIRHGGIDFANAPVEDAKYMLVSCSAFVNYLIEKWSKVTKAKN